MDEAWERIDRALGWLLLSETRRWLRTGRRAAMVLGIAVLYATISMLVGGMLILTPFPGPYTVQVVYGYGSQWWNYPGLLIVQPWGVVALPFLATVAMVLVSAGVGLGMAAGLLLLRDVLRGRANGDRRTSSSSAAAGLTPAMIGLITLGACCSTTAAATAGVGALAQASGSSLYAVQFNTWYIDVFQGAVVWVALIAQEQLLVVAGLLGGRAATPAGAYDAIPERKRVAASLLRLLLVVAGTTWVLTGIAQGAFGDVSGPWPSDLVGGVLLHGFLPCVAIAAGLFPDGAVRAFGRAARPFAVAVRGALGASAAVLLVGVPPGIASAEVHGLANELFAAAGVTGWAYDPGPLGPSVLALRWIFQYGVLVAFGLLAATAPGRFARAIAPRPVPPDASPATGPGTPAVASGGSTGAAAIR